MRKLWHALSLSTAAIALSVSLGGCTEQSASTSTEATSERPMILTLAHGLSETHTVHIAISEFAKELDERTNGRIKVRIFANGQLGSELEQMEQVMAGVISMTKVASPMLATYDDSYHTFGLPYIFNDTEDFYKTMDDPLMYDFFKSSHDKGFVTLTYYTSGSRSFYTVNKPIRTPADLKGMKIRVQDMKSQTEMVSAMGGTPVAMAYGDVFTSLQTGVIDGTENNETMKIRVQDMKSQTEMVSAMGGTPVAMAYGDVFTSLQTGVIDGTENNETALTLGKHGEICKVYSTDQHAMIPDALVISSKVWDNISPEDQKIMVEAARNSTVMHQGIWDKSVEDAIAEAKAKMGVTFINDIDKEAFRQATADMLVKYSKEYAGVEKMLNLIDTIRSQNAKSDAASVN